MATGNPFDLLGDDDNDDPSQLIAAQHQIIASKKTHNLTQDETSKPAGKLPSKPLPPAQAVREAKTETGRGGGRGSGRGYGRDRGRGETGGGFNRDTATENSFRNSGFSPVQGGTEDVDNGKPSERQGGYGGHRGSFRSVRRGAFGNGEDREGERPHRVFERHSGTGRGNEFKREGSGRGNWGTPTDEFATVAEDVVNENENLGAEKPLAEENATDDNEVNPAKEEGKKTEDKEMTLEEYEKVLEEKRKTLHACKAEERKVYVKEFASMQQISNKKGNDDVFVKLGSDKEKRKELFEKDEKSKKPVSINDFLKPGEGERHMNSGGRGRGRGGYSGVRIPVSSNASVPQIEDPGQFPTLGAK